MKKTLEVLNGLEKAGFWDRYAIGGAVAALFYVEPFQTEDLDILILLQHEAAASLAPLSRIYAELRKQGYIEDGPFVMIEGIPVQFLLAYSPLVEEAVREAPEVMYEDARTRVLSAEYLSAIMVDTGRDKDRARLALMRSQAELDEGKLRAIAVRYGLEERLALWTN